jgi:hypothetical protein
MKMNSFFKRSALLLVLLTLPLMLYSCRRQQKKQEEVLAVGPDVESLIAPQDYVTQTIKASGGIQNWIKTKNIEFDCVITFYDTDGSFYLTEHHFEVYPWSNSIQIFANEPMGRFVWQLSNGRFNILKGSEKVDVSPRIISYHDFSDSVLNIVTAPVRFFDKEAVFAKSSEAVKISGQWYYPIERTYKIIQEETSKKDKQKAIKPAEPYWSKVIYYLNRESSIVDIIWFSDIDSEKFFIVRGYDYRVLKGENILIPAKIEIFQSNARIDFKERLVTITVK